MKQVLEAVSRGVRDLFQFQVLWIMIWPLLVSMLIWTVLGIALWTTITGWLQWVLIQTGIHTWLQGVESLWVANVLQVILHLMIFVPLVFLTALVITAIFAMPALIRLVAERHYPDLVRESGGSIIGNISNAFISVALYLAILLLVIPFWFIGLWVIVPFLAASYLNQRMFRYDAISEHASALEMKQLFKQYANTWWGLGMVMGLLQFIPFLNLIAPVLTALVFIHFGLARLQESRATSIPSMKL